MPFIYSCILLADLILLNKLYFMSGSSNKLSILISSVFLALYIITGLLSNFNAIDILAPQWVYYGSINILSCLYFFFNKEDLSPLQPLFKRPYFLLYLFLMVWAIGSYFYAINGVETLINLPRYFNIFFAIVFGYLHLQRLPNRFNFFSTLMVAFLSIELIAYFNDFLEFYSPKGFSINSVKGVSGNKNIAAASIALKIPFALYFASSSFKIWVRVYAVGILTLAFFALSLINARAAILSTGLVILFFVFFTLFNYSRNKNKRLFFANLSFVLLPFILAFSINETLASSAPTKSLSKTIGLIEFSEKGSNGRFLYWRDVLEQVKDHPIFGSGLGNWKIASIAYGKEHVNGYTVPYHAHNDFLQFAAELGLIGFFAYAGLFGILTFILVRYFLRETEAQKKKMAMTLLLALTVYVVDAGLNFPVARPLMQSSFALVVGMILIFTANSKMESKHSLVPKVFLAVSLPVLIGGLAIHIISYISLTKQGRMLYEFNNAQYKLTIPELEEISDTFPNMTETAMPIKSMKARYYYLNNRKAEAYALAYEGRKANPNIYFSENLLAQFYLSEQKIDSAYRYAKLAFENLPKNKPHYDLYMRTLAAKRDVMAINSTFDYARSLFGEDSIVWSIYLRSLMQTVSAGDATAIARASEAYRLFPGNKEIFTSYRILVLGQQAVVQAEQLYKEATALYNGKDFIGAAIKFAQANQIDALEPTYALNAGLANYEAKQFDQALRFFDLVIATRNDTLRRRALRFKALSLYAMGNQQAACDYFSQLRSTGIRMHMQEYTKYCGN